MADNDTTEALDDPVLLPTLTHDRGLNAAVRDSLRILRDEATDRELRERIDAVLSGRASLRELARAPEFEAFVSPYAAAGWSDWDAMEPEERVRLSEESREQIRQPRD